MTDSQLDKPGFRINTRQIMGGAILIGVGGELLGREQVRGWQVMAEDSGDAVRGVPPRSAGPHLATDRGGEELRTGAHDLRHRGSGGGRRDR